MFLWWTLPSLQPPPGPWLSCRLVIDQRIFCFLAEITKESDAMVETVGFPTAMAWFFSEAWYCWELCNWSTRRQCVELESPLSTDRRDSSDPHHRHANLIDLSFKQNCAIQERFLSRFKKKISKLKHFFFFFRRLLCGVYGSNTQRCPLRSQEDVREQCARPEHLQERDHYHGKCLVMGERFRCKCFYFLSWSLLLK